MSLSRTCSKCGHISQICSKCSHNNDGGENSIMLFGVQLTRGTNNTTTNTNNNNPSQYQQPAPQVFTSTDTSNVSDNVVHASEGSSENKRENFWTAEEHMMYLEGLEKLGKGNWTKISKDFVKTRTPTQVASHAQKHFLYLMNKNCRGGGKPSIFDMTLDTEVESSTNMEDEQIQQETVVPLPPPTPTAYPSTHNGGIPDNPLPMGVGTLALPVLPLSWVDLNDDGSSFTETFPLSLKLQQFLPPSDDHSLKSSGHSSPSASSSTFNSMSAGKSSGGTGDNITSVD